MNGRNLVMAERIERTPVAYPFRFVVAGDFAAWYDPTADGIFATLLEQIEELDPRPLFLVNLGDFAGPGTLARHEASRSTARDATGSSSRPKAPLRDA